jgi:hypothetical protein
MRSPRRFLRRFGLLRVRGPDYAPWLRHEPTPPPCPPGFSIGAPDFIGVGAQKAGTTYWFHLIADHPDVYQPAGRRPELHFWDRFSHAWPTADDIARYHRLFPRPPGSVTGEKTPEYMAYYWIPPMLKEAAPDARILILLRDPIERYRSAAAHGADKGWDKSAGNEQMMFERGLYAGQIARILDTFGPERILILQYERCIRDVPTELARTYRFLGLAPHVPPDAVLSRPRNVSRGAKAPIDPQRLAVLRRRYEAEVKRVRDSVPDLDLSLWPNFAQLD